MNSFNFAPRPELLGIKDISGRTPAVPPEQIPTHCPLFHTYAERGGVKPQLVDATAAEQYFGAATFDVSREYTTHQTPFINRAFSRANVSFVKRIIPDDAPPPAALRLSVDLLETKVPLWQINEDGTYFTDVNGERVQEVDIDDEPVFIDGLQIKWVATGVARRNADGVIITPAMEAAAAANPSDAELQTAVKPVANALGVGTVGQGDQADPDTSAISTRYPAYEFEVPWVGSAGDLQGVRLFAATSEASIGDQSDIGAAIESFVYGIQFLEKADASTKAVLVSTLTQATYRLFSNKPSVLDPRTKQNYGYKKSIIPHWNDDVSSLLPVEGPFGAMYVYESNIETIANKIIDVESDINQEFPTDNYHLVNIVDFKHYNGAPYRSVSQIGESDDGVILNEVSVIYATGGGNGTMSPTNFNSAVREQFSRFGNMPGLNYMDYLLYPFSIVYDSGFDLPTKNAMLSLIGKRKDIFVVVCTQDVSLPQNTDDVESSIGITLFNRAQMFAESTLYGTEACRGMIVAQSGYLPSGEYEQLLPVTYDLLDRFAKYMSAGNKRWSTIDRPDESPNNVIATLIKVNGTSRLEESFSKDWNNGITYARTWDRRSAFHPLLRTFYPDQTSILLSAPNTLIACDLEKISILAWRDTVGNANYTAEERLEATEAKIIAEVEVRGGYDGRVTVEANAFYTEEDRINGNSCHVEITMRGNNPGSVTRFTVIAARADDAA